MFCILRTYATNTSLWFRYATRRASIMSRAVPSQTKRDKQKYAIGEGKNCQYQSIQETLRFFCSKFYTTRPFLPLRAPLDFCFMVISLQTTNFKRFRVLQLFFWYVLFVFFLRRRGPRKQSSVARRDLVLITKGCLSRACLLYMVSVRSQHAFYGKYCSRQKVSTRTVEVCLVWTVCCRYSRGLLLDGV